MDKRIKIQIQLPLDDNSKAGSVYKYKYKVEGESTNIFEDIFEKTGGEKDDNLNSDCKLWLVVHPMEDLLNAGDKSQNWKAPLTQDLLLDKREEQENKGEKKEEKKKEEDLDLLPVVHITTTRLFLPAIYSTQPLHRLVPRYHLIMDDSIWNYHVSIFDKEEIENTLPDGDPIAEFVKKDQLKDFKDKFIDVLKSIKKNYERHLYHLQVSKEYADLHARMASQAYLTGAHASGVSPFVFHSEGFIKMMIKREFEEKDGENLEKSLKKDDIIAHKWRFLLVDDKAMNTMEYKPDKPELKDEINGCPWNCKLAIIEKTLRHYFGWDDDKNIKKIQHRPWDSTKDISDCTILIEYAQTLDDAKAAMHEKKYDIVLLDYLLDSDNVTHDQNYGYSLLNDIYKDKADNDEFNNYQLGPSERFFFMFISAYTTAVYERTRAEALNLSEEYWHISLGACPTNTPQLFLYNLLKLMEKRLNDSGMTNLFAKNIANLMDRIYKEGEGGDSVRSRANKLYEKVLSLHYHYRKIMKDVAIPSSGSVFDTRGSVLMTDFANSNPNLAGLLEHMANLVHITAFGTIRQWPEMWEEYLYFKAVYKQQYKEDNEGMYQAIENYILDLKSEQG